MKKQKLLNEDNYIFFIDSTSIKVSTDANKNKNNQEQSIGHSKRGAGNEVTPMLYIFMSSGFSFVSWQFSQCFRRKKID